MSNQKSLQQNPPQKEKKSVVDSEKADSTGSQLNQNFKKMSYSQMLFSGLGNMVLLVIFFWIHWSLGALFLIFWLFVMPFLDLRRLRKREAENPPQLPKSSEFDDTPFYKEEVKRDEEDDSWKSWDDWDEWKKPKE